MQSIISIVDTAKAQRREADFGKSDSVTVSVEHNCKQSLKSVGSYMNSLNLSIT